MFRYLIIFLLLAFSAQAANTPPPGSNSEIIYNNNSQWGALPINWQSVTTIPQPSYHPEGDDLTAPSDAGGATVRYANLLAGSLGVGATNYGVDGALACDVTNFQTFAHDNPGASNDPLVTYQDGINDVAQGVGSYETGVFKPCLQGAFTWLAIPSTTKVIVNLTNCTHTGSWPTSSPTGYAYSSSAIYTYTQSANSSLACSITTTGGPIYVWSQLKGNINGEMAIDVDGSGIQDVYGDTTPSLDGIGQGYGVNVTIFTGISAGTHIVNFTSVANGASFPYFVPMAIGTLPSSYSSSTGPIVFAAGVPYQQSNANATATAAYNTDVQSVVTLLAGQGLPVYFMNTRNYANSTTNMATSLLLNNSGQTNMETGFYNLITSTLTGLTSGTAISATSGGFGSNISTANGIPNFTSGVASFGNVTIQNGGTSSSTAQGALSNLFSPGLESAAPIVAPCAGSLADQTLISSAYAASLTAHTSMTLPPDCGLTGQVQMTYNTYFNLFGWATAYGTPGSSGNPYLTINSSDISNTAPGSAAFDMAGVLEANFLNGNIIGTGQSEMSLVSNSVDNSSGIATRNSINFINENIGHVGTVIGCTVDDVHSCVLIGGISESSITITSNGAGYTPGTYSNVPVAGGSGSGASFYSVTIGTSGAVTSITDPYSGDSTLTGGTNYTTSDTLTIGTSSVGGTGGGFSFTPTRVFPVSAFTRQQLVHIYGSNFGNFNCFLCGQFSDLFMYNNDFGGGGPITKQNTGASGGSQVANNRFEFTQGLYFDNFGPIFVNSNYWTNISNGPALSLARFSGGVATDMAAVGNVIQGDFTPGSYAPIEIGSSISGTVADLAFGFNVIDENGLGAPACFDIAHGDHIFMGGNICVGAPSVEFKIVPAHYVVDNDDLHAESGTRPYGIGTSAPLGIGTAAMDFEVTTAIRLPTGSTGQRPGSPVEGLFRDNITLHAIEAYVNGAWIAFGGGTINTGTYTDAAIYNTTGTTVSGTSMLTIGTSGGLGVAIGTGIAASSAPVNGLTVQGNVGIGTTTPGYACGLGSPIGSGQCRAVYTTSTSVTLPSDWNISSNKIEAIGAGGNGAGGGGNGGGGGGGGEYCYLSNLSDAAGTSETATIGTGGSGTATSFKNSSTINAVAGTSGSGATAGSGGTAGTGTGCFNGGNGGSGGGSGNSGGGGGGAGGLNGVGNVGQNGITTSGGVNGGSGDAGSGGAGGSTGSSGGNGTEWSSSPAYGSGGGGGSGTHGSNANGGGGGTYGGAGGGGSGSGSGGSGAGGIIIITYTPFTSTLAVNGGIAAGAYGNNGTAPPINGLIISGNVGIGTTGTTGSPLSLVGLGTTAPIGTTTGAGYLCVDNAGHIYQKSSCP